MKVYLTMGRDGRVLVQARTEQQGIIGHVLHYVAQGEEFNGVGFDDLAKATPGPMDLPQQDPGMVQPDTTPADAEAPKPNPEVPPQQ